MIENFNSIPAKTLENKAQNNKEFKIINTYINKLIKHKISFLDESNYSFKLSASDRLLAHLFFTDITDLIKKYKPENFIIEESKQWPQLIINTTISNDHIQQSQHMSDITEIYAIKYFTKELENIQNKLGENNLIFKFNNLCDIFNTNHEDCKLDIIYDINKKGISSKILIECKCLSFAFFSELIVKNIFNAQNDNLLSISEDILSNFKNIFTQYEPYSNDNSMKFILDNNFAEILSKIEKKQEYFLPYVESSINKVITFNVNKKNKQMQLFTKDSKNILFVSFCDLIYKHNVFQVILNHYYNQNIDDIPNIKLKIIDNKLHNIEWITILFRYESMKYHHYELLGINEDESGLYYEYKLRETSSFNSFLAS